MLRKVIYLPPKNSKRDVVNLFGDFLKDEKFTIFWENSTGFFYRVVLYTNHDSDNFLSGNEVSRLVFVDNWMESPL